jgi:site-specific recombinase XerD
MMLMSGIRRKLGSAPAQKAPVLRDDIRRMVAVQPDTLAGLRNRALLLVGFAGAFRRSELTGLDVSDLRFTDEGVVITSAAANRSGAGASSHIPTLKSRALCPVTALRRWLEEADIHQGPIFRAVDRWGHVRKRRLTAQVVAAVVKQAAVAAGLDPRQYAGHSLRAGFVTQASLDDEDVLRIQEVTGHTDMNTIVKHSAQRRRKARETVRRALGNESHQRDVNSAPCILSSL